MKKLILLIVTGLIDFVFIVMVLFSSSQDRLDIKDISYRPPQFAGSFYPSHPDLLRKNLDDFLKLDSPLTVEDSIIALVVPHAGYVYSGWVAGKAYRQVNGLNYDAVIIIGPSHQKSFKGSSVFSGDAYVTPLGNAMIDKKLSIEIASVNQNVRLSLDGHDWRTQQSEHSIEVQIPFLQRVLPNVPIVPICMGSQDNSSIDDLMKAIVFGIKNSGKNILIVASSDLSHYHDLLSAKSMDMPLTSAFGRLDYFKIASQCSSRKWEACGFAPIAVAMMAAEQLGANDAKPLLYSTSAGSPYAKASEDRVVGYLSGAIIKNENKTLDILPKLSEKNKKTLLKAARQTVEACSGKKENYSPGKSSPELSENYAAFVTLKKKGELRGCMGHTFSNQPLIDEVIEAARLASTHDPRFPSVRKSELNDLVLEISVLSRYKRVLDTGEIQTGDDGVYLRLGDSTGLFLPQVAREQKWDTKTFLEHLGLKAGLKKDAYLNPNAELYRFRALVIKED
ncbi:MAG: hypothetical protein HW421_3008 [Ignavibacteria bacterium]|nr:hypothetical protein [Ignavibacteria bacterium]